MGGLPQFAEMMAVAAGVLGAMLVLAFFVGKLFQNMKIRKRIMIGAAAIWLVGFVGFFGFVAFILSGNLN